MDGMDAMIDTAVPEKVTREEVEIAAKLMKHARNVLLRAIEQGEADLRRKKEMREKVMAGAFVVDNVASEIERFALKK